jgi:hypothetical protein
MQMYSLEMLLRKLKQVSQKSNQQTAVLLGNHTTSLIVTVCVKCEMISDEYVFARV